MTAGLVVRAGGPAMAREPSMAGLIVVAVNRMPAADVEVSADLVRRLLAAQHPDLAPLPVEFLANGWDNELYRVGDGLLARLPRRALGAQIIKNEQRWLPGLAARLPLPVPYPERTGVPAHGYPYSWSVVPYLPGVPGRRPAPSTGREPRPRSAGSSARSTSPPRRTRRPTRSAASRWPSARAASRPTSPCVPARISWPGRGTSRVGRGARGPRLRRPAPLAARRPAPGEHSRE